MRKSLQALVVTIAAAAIVTAIAAISGSLESVLGDFSIRVFWAMLCIALAMLVFLGIDMCARNRKDEWREVVFAMIGSIGAGFALSFPENLYLLWGGCTAVAAMVFCAIFFTDVDDQMAPPGRKSDSDSTKTEIA